MPAIFIMVENLINKWCISLMALEEWLVSSAFTTGGSFFGAALFWYIQCPNKRCCQMSAVHKAVERTQELK
jgi:hypothetical protein